MSHAPIIKQYSYDVNCWERSLAFFLIENIYFKERLSEILNTADDEELLLNCEQFQEQFLEQDRILSFLDTEVKRQKRSLGKMLYENDELFKEVVKQQKKLRNDMKKEEALFTKVKDSFSNFLSERF